MSKDQIQDMKTGSELDLLVAEKVMGYKAYVPSHGGGCVADTGKAVTIFSPSTDISAAWEVFEKLGEQFAVRRTSTGYIAHVITDKTEEAIQCETAAEAICKVALLTYCYGTTEHA